MKPRAWVWPIVIAASACAAALGMADLLPGALRAAAEFWFLAVCPGMAIVQLLRVDGRAAQWAIAIALSLALETALAEVMALAQWWSPARAVLLLIVLSLAGASWQLLAGSRPLRRGDAP